MSTETGRRQVREPEDTFAVAVVRAVAEREGREPAELRPPLASVLDIDALNTLGNDAVVRFHYHGYEVTVEDGRVTVADP